MSETNLTKNRVKAVITLTALFLALVTLGYIMKTYWTTMPLGTRLVIESAAYFLGFITLLTITAAVLYIFTGLLIALTLGVIERWRQ